MESGVTAVWKRESPHAGSLSAPAHANSVAPRTRAAPTRSLGACPGIRAAHVAITRRAPPNMRQPADVSNAPVKMQTGGASATGPSAGAAGASRVRRVWAIGTLVLWSFSL